MRCLNDCRSFSILLAKYQEYAVLDGDYNAYDELNGHSDMITVFVPSDEAIAKIPQQQLTLLIRDSVELKKVRAISMYGAR